MCLRSRNLYFPSPRRTYNVTSCSSSSTAKYSLPFCRKDATPQYFILNLAGSSVSVKEPIISAQTSQLLWPERKDTSHANLTAQIWCDCMTTTGKAGRIRAPVSKEVKWNRVRGILQTAYLKSLTLPFAVAVICPFSSMVKSATTLSCRNSPSGSFFAMAYQMPLYCKEIRKVVVRPRSMENYIQALKTRGGEVTDGRTCRYLTPCLKVVPRKQI